MADGPHARAEAAGEAMELMRQAERDGRPFRLVITDAHMPEVDGFTLAGEIRERYQAADPVIMMLTSGDRPSDIARMRTLGIAAYLLKPIKQSELLEAIQLSLGLVGPRSPLVLPARRPPRPSAAKSCWPKTVWSTRNWPSPCSAERATK